MQATRASTCYFVQASPKTSSRGGAARGGRHARVGSAATKRKKPTPSPPGDPHGEWQCPDCTFKNAKKGSVACEMCGRRRVTKAHSTVSSEVSKYFEDVLESVPGHGAIGGHSSDGSTAVVYAIILGGVVRCWGYNTGCTHVVSAGRNPHFRLGAFRGRCVQQGLR